MAKELAQYDKPESSENSVRSLINERGTEIKQWVTFNINGELFAVDALHVVEVQKYDQTTPVPGSSAFISGLINLRGKVITVIDTRLMLALPHSAPDEKNNIILVDFNEDEMVGFIVDRVDEVINIETKSIEATQRLSGNDAKNKFVRGVTFYNQSMVIILDVEKIISHLTPVIEIN